FLSLNHLLSNSVGDSRKAVRRECLDTLIRVLMECGETFSCETWELLLRGVLGPMME
ncbi:unnamed protein product, partial [Chrysoparadoxa australica]